MDLYLPRAAEKLPPDLLVWAREMRHGMTDAEALLWRLLRNRRVAGAKFRRQHAVGRFILDFCCDEHKVCVELDGGQHADESEYDTRRDTWLNERGIQVLRFWNNQVLAETESVLEVIYGVLTGSGPSSALTPGPSPASGRGEKGGAA